MKMNLDEQIEAIKTEIQQKIGMLQLLEALKASGASIEVPETSPQNSTNGKVIEANTATA